MKIAIAVENKELQVAKRMGRAPWFAIYQVEGLEFTLLDLAENAHAKEHHGDGGHHHEEHNEAEIEHHRQHIEPLKGIDGILARAVGPNMKDALQREGRSPFRVYQRVFYLATNPKLLTHHDGYTEKAFPLAYEF